MYQVDEKPETIHLYVVREEVARPSIAPIILSVLSLSLLIALGCLPYEQPEIRTAIRVPAVPLPIQNFGISVTVIPTGHHIIEATTARGTLTITNGSILSGELPKGTIFTGKDGIEIVTDASVFIPAGSASGYGATTVSAHAVLAGDQGNISALDINVIYGSAVYVRNLSSFQGGKRRLDVSYATSEDRLTALENARTRLKAQIIAGILAHPCSEQVNGVVELVVKWACQFITFKPLNISNICITGIKVQGKNLILEVVYPERPRRIETK